MRRYLIYLLLLLLSLGCVRELDILDDRALEPFPEGEKVTLTFSVPDSEMMPSTKAPFSHRLGEAAHMDSLFVAVFGSSGYLKEYVKAQKLKEVSYTYTDGYGLPHTVPAHEFQITLTMSAKRRIIHFIGNGPSTLPFGYDYEVIPSLLSKSGEQSLWQIMIVDNISARMENGRYVKNADGVYEASESTRQDFTDIPLIKNWSKLSVSVAPGANFELKSFAVINVPTQGTVAPAYFDPVTQKNKFIETYQAWTFDQLTARYDGNLPDGVAFNTSIPTAQDFQNGTNGVIDYEKVKSGLSQDSCLYVYERPVPTRQMPPTAVIVYGKYDNPDDPNPSAHNGKYYYYKIDLMQEGEYYPIYRNFKYELNISKILSFGHMTPEAAAASAGTANVSSDVTTQHLPDISDGEARLVIQPWLAQSFTRRQVNNNILHVKFFDDVMSGRPSMNPNNVTCEILPMDDGADNMITSVSVGDPVFGNEIEMGWRTITFSTTDPTSKARSQTIRITGSYETETIPPVTKTLYRDVVITLQPLQDMVVEAELNPGTEVDVDVTISIPDGLVESMFPLDFIIEPEDMTLTPNNLVDNNNLPVLSGTSISEHAEYYGKRAFQFQRTLSWSEYQSLPLSMDADGRKWRTVVCKFKTTRRMSATTVWVANDFFNKAHDAFDNPSNNYFYIKAESEGGCKVKIKKSNLSYFVNEWADYKSDSTITLHKGDQIFFRVKNYTGSADAILNWSGQPITVTKPSEETNGYFSVGGDITSLMVGDRYQQEGPGLTGVILTNLFKNKSNLIDASALIIPMTDLKNSALKNMFQGCSNLEAPPRELPAKTLVGSVVECYRDMFSGCTKITQSPNIMATDISSDSFKYMFNGCTNLKVIRMMSKTWTSGAFTDWVDGVAAEGTIYVNAANTDLLGTNPPTTAQRGTSAIPTGWNIETLVVQ